MRLIAGIATLFAAILVTGTAAANELLPEQPVPQPWEFERWQTDFTRATVPFREIRSVIGRDNIPSIDEPTFLPVSEETTIPGLEPVIALEVGDEARAYPLRLMMWHEIVNDEIAGQPLAITYCPLCNSSLVFRRTLDGLAVEFGTTGKLRNSDLVMYDRTSWTWWQQFTGEGLVGEHAGKVLDIVPSRLMSFDLFAETFPEGQVLQPDPRRSSSLGRNPYVRYDGTLRPFLFTGELPEDIAALARVVVVRTDAGPEAVSLQYLRANQPVRLGDYELRWTAGQASALDTEQIADGQDVGNVEVVRNPGPDEEPAVHEIAFAFAARAFYPDLSILQ